MLEVVIAAAVGVAVGGLLGSTLAHLTLNRRVTYTADEMAPTEWWVVEYSGDIPSERDTGLPWPPEEGRGWRYA